MCILVLKKCKKPDDVLFINASEHYEKGKRQNNLLPEDIEKIISTYKERPEKIERYARRVPMDEIIEKHGYNLNISRYVSTAEPEKEIKLSEVNRELRTIEQNIEVAFNRHNKYLAELGLDLLP